MRNFVRWQTIGSSVAATLLTALLTSALPASASLADDPAWAAYDEGRYTTALELARKQAAQGEPAAHTLVGRILNEGLAAARDPKQAAEWYRKGAELGDANAQLALGLLHVRGDGMPADADAAAAWFEKSAAAGNARASYNLGILYATGRGRPTNVRKAAELMEIAAKAGEMAAAYDLAQLLCEPLNYEIRNPAKAAEWMGKAAQAGLVEAQLEFAIMLFKGRCVPEDRKRGALYLTLAAERGNPVAQNRLALLYAEGVVYKRDLRAAAKWHLLARAAGLNDLKLDLFLGSLPAEERSKAAVEAERWRESRLGP